MRENHTKGGCVCVFPLIVLCVQCESFSCVLFFVLFFSFCFRLLGVASSTRNPLSCTECDPIITQTFNPLCSSCKAITTHLPGVWRKSKHIIDEVKWIMIYALAEWYFVVKCNNSEKNSYFLLLLRCASTVFYWIIGIFLTICHKHPKSVSLSVRQENTNNDRFPPPLLIYPFPLFFLSLLSTSSAHARARESESVCKKRCWRWLSPSPDCKIKQTAHDETCLFTRLYSSCSWPGSDGFAEHCVLWTLSTPSIPWAPTRHKCQHWMRGWMWVGVKINTL